MRPSRSGVAGAVAAEVAGAVFASGVKKRSSTGVECEVNAQPATTTMASAFTGPSGRGP